MLQETLSCQVPFIPFHIKKTLLIKDLEAILYTILCLFKSLSDNIAQHSVGFYEMSFTKLRYCTLLQSKQTAWKPEMMISLHLH